VTDPRRDGLSRPKVIFFDAGHTLLQPRPSVERRYVETAASYGVQADAELVRQRFSLLWRSEREGRERALYRTDPAETRRFWRDFVFQVFEPWMKECRDFETFFNELYEAFSRGSAWHLFDDVLPCLERVHSLGYSSGVISNWDRRLRGLLGTMGLASEFETILVSAEEGYEKPAPVIFERALERCGVEPAEALHVGDSFDDDVRGACGAGLLAAHLDRGLDVTERWRWHQEGHLVVPSLIALGDFLENIS
jgi:putative hydrolase of the HAD superfamily